MADYYESHYASREPSYSRGDPMDETAMRRSITRDSHQSHPSVSPSTRSWVYSNQIHPPPPPDDDATPSPSPARRPLRPLPDPTLHQSRSAYQYGLQEVEQEGEHFEVQPPTPAALPFGFPTDELGDESPFQLPASPSLTGNHIRPPLRENRTFVGGLFSGLKRLPKILKGGGGSKQKLKRKGTFGTDTHTEGTSTTAMTKGNTLPRYLSNPSIGPSNPQFAHRLSMAVNNGSLPPGSTPAVFHVRENQAGPQFPMVTITPASDSHDRITEEQASFFEGPQDEQPNHFSGNHNDRGESMVPDLQERTTVMVYNTDSQAPTMAPAPLGPTPPRAATPGPRVSYQAQLPTRANVQAQSEPPLHAPTPVRVPPPIIQSPKEVLSSTQATSSYTISAAPSFYDPSYSSSLTPVEKFFKGLYHIPWVAHERITVDYRPGDSKRAQDKIRGLKKPMASWYRSIIPRSRRTSRSLDLLSSGTPTSSPQTSFGNPLTPLASPISRRSGRSSNTNGRSKPKHHHRRKRHTVSSSTTGFQIPQRTTSPIIPTAYPYAYPGYPYGYPYGAYPAAMPVSTSPRGPRKHKSKRTMKYPHGYAPYHPMAMPSMPSMAAPMPTAGPPPIYFISPSPPQSANGGEGAGNQANGQLSAQFPQAPPPPLPHPQVSPVIMHFVPGGYNPNQNIMVSPPLTPQRHEAYGS